MFTKITYEVEDASAVITLDRPDDLNTIVPPMLEELESAVGKAFATAPSRSSSCRGRAAPSAAASTSPAASRNGTRPSPATASGMLGATS